MYILVPHQKKHNRKSTPAEKRVRRACRWLRLHTSPLCIGRAGFRKDGTFGPIFENTEESLLRAFNQHIWRLSRHSNEDYQEHFAGRTTLYCTGATGANDYMLMMGDVDCKRGGTPEGAESFCSYISELPIFEKMGCRLYWEPSTGGRGRHFYFLLYRNGYDISRLKELVYKRLKPYLRRIADEKGFDIEFFDRINGMCMERKWSQNIFGNSYVSELTLGTLAKVPRDVSRFDEWKTMPVVYVDDLLRLPVPAKDEAGRKLAAFDDVIDMNCGSSSGCPVGQADIESLPHLRKLVSKWLKSSTLKTSTRAVATEEDLAIFLMIGAVFTENMNASGEMPTGRYKDAWDKLYAAGKISRPWDHHRYAACRNYLSSIGMLEAQDWSYSPPTKFDATTGRGLNGRCCKWSFSDELMSLIREEKSTYMGTQIIQSKDFGVPVFVIRLPEDHHRMVETPEYQKYEEMDHWGAIAA